MRYLVVLAALLVAPIAADADFVVDMSRFDVVVTISVAGTVPLAGGDLVLDDTFVLTGAGGAFIRRSPPPLSLFFRSAAGCIFQRLRRWYFGLWFRLRGGNTLLSEDFPPA